MARSSQPLGWILGLAALIVITYWPVTQFEFVNWDDNTYVTENPHVQGGLTKANVVWALTSTEAPYWHPLTWLSHQATVEMFGLDAGGHHLVNVVIHLANTLLLFLLLSRLTGAIGMSAFVAALFGVHPLHVESVAWVAERKDVLSTFFLFSTIAMYVAYVRRPHWSRYIAVVGLFVLAVMSKPMAVTLPVLLLLIDIWPLARVSAARWDRQAWMRAVVEKLPLAAIAVAAAIATFVVQERVGAVAGLSLLTWQERLANAIVSYGSYVALTFWPSGLAAFYPYQPLPLALVVGSALALAGTTAVMIRRRDRAPYLLVGWLWYLLTLVPVIGLVQAGQQSMADRFTYVPLIGIFIMLTWGLAERSRQWLIGPTRLRSMAVIAVLCCALLARAQTMFWADSVTLWQRAVDVTPANYRAFENLGTAQRDRGLLDQALRNYAESARLAPENSAIYNSMGLVLTRQGRVEEAVTKFRAAIERQPDFVEAQNNLGNALAALGRLPEAIDRYREVLRCQPEAIDTRTNLGNVLATTGRLDDAIQEYQRAIVVNPNLKEAHVGLGAALLKQHKPAEAVDHFRAALRADPQFAEAHNGLGAALSLSGDADGAARAYEEALRLKPDLVSAHFNLALLLIKQGKIGPATAHLERAAALDPNYVPARQALAELRRRSTGG